MRYLLDTCTAVWMFEGSPTMPVSVRQTLTNPVHEVFFSDVSLLEIEIKYAAGKFPLKEPPSRSVLPLVRKHGLDNLPLLLPAIVMLEQLPLHHRDPFDRLLLAQARVHRCILVTPDPLMRSYDIPLLW